MRNKTLFGAIAGTALLAATGAVNSEETTVHLEDLLPEQNYTGYVHGKTPHNLSAISAVFADATGQKVSVPCSEIKAEYKNPTSYELYEKASQAVFDCYHGSSGIPAPDLSDMPTLDA